MTFREKEASVQRWTLDTLCLAITRISLFPETSREEFKESVSISKGDWGWSFYNMPDKLFWMCKVIFLLGQRSNMEFYYSERRNSRSRYSTMSAVIESHGGVSLSLLALFYFTLLQKYCRWCQTCVGGGGDQHFRQLGTVAYYSKAKCQNFIAFEPQGLPSLGC